MPEIRIPINELVDQETFDKIFDLAFEHTNQYFNYECDHWPNIPHDTADTPEQLKNALYTQFLKENE